MTAWLDEFYIGTDLDSDFNTLNELFNTDEVVDPDSTFAPFAAYTDNVDGSRSGVGFPMANWKWNARDDAQIEILQEFWAGALSVPLYIRTRTNRLDIYGAPVYRTFLCEALWPPKDEDHQAGATLGFEIEFRHLVLQSEAT
jgi:hypothetical protein